MAGWKKFAGYSQYPELTTNSDGSASIYGSKRNRNFRMAWLQGRRNSALEQEILTWITRTTGDQLSNDTEEVLEQLHDGKILCRFLATVTARPLIRPISEKAALFSANENVSIFLDTLRALGLRDDELFPPSDLLEKRDISGLVSTLKVLRDYSQ